MGCGDVAVMILDEMQMFDQEIAAARPVGEQRLNVAKRGRVDLAALRRAPGLAPAGGTVSDKAQSRAPHGLIDKSYQ